MNRNTFYEIAKNLDYISLSQICKTNSQYYQYCQNPEIRELYISNKSMTNDNFYQIVEKMDLP